MLTAGTRVGPYEIVSWLGAGGMGEVYRARDTTLGREVALKTLPDELAREPRRLTRLRTEARVLASLNHPGIATLFGVEDLDGGVPVLVMELVEGETLADRMRRGPLALKEALAVADQIAFALGAAHEKGVLHRDLKPANIRLSREGRVKLLDFGLADVVREAALDSQVDTHTSPSSHAHALVGTAPYMSPEQARGQEVDRRGDIWAFGCIVFEMLTGERAFAGVTFSDTVAAVLDREPRWEALPRDTPVAASRLLRRCLEKEKDQRLRDIGDARLEVEDLLAGSTWTEHAMTAPSRHPSWTVWVLLGALLGGLVAWLIQRPATVRRDVLRFAVDWSDDPVPGSLLVSPAGDRIVYNTARGPIVRELDQQEGRLLLGATGLPGTAGASTGAAVDSPFFSPDGRWIGFHDGADSTLKKVSLTGGAPLALGKDVFEAYGATWGPDDRIVFTPNNFSGLWLAPASGGEPRELTKPDRSKGEKSHRWPHYLPGGKAVLFTVGSNRLDRWDDARIEALVLGTGERRAILEGGTSPVYVQSGHLLYRRGTSILAAPFDLDRLEVTGASVAIVDGVQSPSFNGAPFFTVAREGLLAYVPHTARMARLVLVDRAGEARPLSAFIENVREPRLSPDGRSVAVRRSGANGQVWRFDIEREAFSQVTFEWDNIVPVWTADGKSLIVSSTPGFKLHRVSADGSGRPELLGETLRGAPGSVTPDGKFLLFHSEARDTKGDIWILPLDRAGEPRMFLQTPGFGRHPMISPDGRCVAYESHESGSREIYPRSFPGGGGKVQVSSGGGFHPVWARTGEELFYRVEVEGNRRRMMVVDVQRGPTIRISRPRTLFEDSFDGSDDSSFDVLPDGKHFVMIETKRDPITHFNIVLNWFEELKRLVPSR
jgi:eukaryotic-like serine/threonine-protein kinase